MLFIQTMNRVLQDIPHPQDIKQWSLRYQPLLAKGLCLLSWKMLNLFSTRDRTGFIRRLRDFLSVKPIRRDDLGSQMWGVVGNGNIIIRNGVGTEEPSITLIRYKNKGKKGKKKTWLRLCTKHQTKYVDVFLCV